MKALFKSFSIILKRYLGWGLIIAGYCGILWTFVLFMFGSGIIPGFNDFLTSNLTASFVKSTYLSYISTDDSSTISQGLSGLKSFWTLKGVWRFFPFFQSITAIVIGYLLLKRFSPKFLRSGIHFFRTLCIVGILPFIIGLIVRVTYGNENAVNRTNMEVGNLIDLHIAKSNHNFQTYQAVRLRRDFLYQGMSRDELKYILYLDSTKFSSRSISFFLTGIFAISFIFLMTYLYEFVHKFNWKTRYDLVTAGIGDLKSLKDPTIIEYRHFVSKDWILDIIKKTAPQNDTQPFSRFDFESLDEFDKLALWKFSKDSDFITQFLQIHPNRTRGFYEKQFYLKSVQHYNLHSIAYNYLKYVSERTRPSLAWKMSCKIVFERMPWDIRNDSQIFNMAFRINTDCILFSDFINEKKYVLIAIEQNPEGVFNHLKSDGLKQDEEVLAAYSNALARQKLQGATEV